MEKKKIKNIFTARKLFSLLFDWHPHEGPSKTEGKKLKGKSNLEESRRDL